MAISAKMATMITTRSSMRVNPLRLLSLARHSPVSISSLVSCRASTRSIGSTRSPLYSYLALRKSEARQGWYYQMNIDADRVRLLYALHALLWINDPQALDNLESTVVCLGNVHVHSDVMLTGHHFSWTTRPLGDLCVVQGLDDIFLL